MASRPWLLPVLIATLFPVRSLCAQATAAPADLEQRVARLEQDVAQLKGMIEKLGEDFGTAHPTMQALQTQMQHLEGQLAAATQPADARQRVEQQQQHARQRMARDAQKYSREQLREAESLYQTANRDWRSPAAQAALEKMVKLYPDINRTGCAILYLGQMNEGAEREKYLQQAIEDYSDCYYGDGVQVGAYARHLLWQHYQQSGETEKAAKLIEELRTQYPDAIDHRGNSIIDRLPAI